MSQKIEVETCEKGDIGAVQALCDVLYSEDSAISGLRVDISLTYMEFQNYPEKGRLLVLKSNGTIVGYCIIVFFWSNEYSGNLIEIDELNVAETHRGCGAGTQLFDWLKVTYPACKGFTLQVSDKNIRAREWYQRLGFTTSRNQHMIWII